MPDLDSSIWIIFAFGTLGLTALVVAIGVAVVSAQRRILALHRTHTRALLEAQDEERAWVAREVHDDAIQRLAAIRHEIGACESAIEGLDQHPAVATRIEGIKGEVEDLAASLRGLAHRLHPFGVDQGNLSIALRQLAQEVGRIYGVEVAIHLPNGPALNGKLPVLGVYRIAQESLRNVARHAGVDRAEIRATVEDSFLTLTIRDEGKGFDPGAGRRASTGIGMYTIRERAALIGGSASIDSKPGGGTTVTIRVPITPPGS